MSKANVRSIRHKMERGFNMVELLVVIVIAGILAALAVPSYNTFIATQRVKTASFDIIAALTLARSEAIKRNANADITLTGNNWQNGWTITAPGVTLGEREAVKGATIACNPSPCPDVTYTPNGRITQASAQSIQISSTSAEVSARCINIDRSGRPNSKRGNC